MIVSKKLPKLLLNMTRYKKICPLDKRDGWFSQRIAKKFTYNEELQKQSFGYAY